MRHERIWLGCLWETGPERQAGTDFGGPGMAQGVCMAFLCALTLGGPGEAVGRESSH